MPSKNIKPVESPSLQDIFDILHYQKDGIWLSLPEWAKFFLNLGNYLSSLNLKKNRFVIAISVPTRSYVATLIGSGITVGRARIPIIGSDYEYYEKILSLKEGAPLKYRDGNRKKNAKRKGELNYNGKRLIGIQIDEGVTNTIKYISPENAKFIEIIDKDDVKLPHQQKGREILPPSKLLQSLLGDVYIDDFVFQTRLECVFIGPLNSLKQEISTPLATRRFPLEDCAGSISDLLRVHEFQPSSQAYRTSTLAAISKRNTKIASEVSPFAVIFDSSLGFVKWRDYWRNFNWVVILDRTDLNFQYAVDQMNQEYFSRSEKPYKPKIPSIPAGIEIMFFTVDL